MMGGILLLALTLGSGAVFGASGESALVLLPNASKEVPELSQDIQNLVESGLAPKVELVSAAAYFDALSRAGLARRSATFPRTISRIGKDAGVTHAVVFDAAYLSERVENRRYRRRALYLVTTVVEVEAGRRVFSGKYPLMKRRLGKGVAKALVRDLAATLELPASIRDDDLDKAFQQPVEDSSDESALKLMQGPAAIQTTAMAKDPSAEDDDSVEDDSDDEVVIIEDDSDDEVVIIEDDSDDEVVIVDDDSDDDSSEFEGSRSSLVSSSSTRFHGEYHMQGVSDLGYARNGEDVIEWWNFARLKLDHQMSDVSAVVEAWIRWGMVAETTKRGDTFYVLNARNPKWASDIQLREGYLFWKLGAVSLKLGQRIFVWGQNEYQPPADILNPTDMRYGLLSSLGSTRDGKVPIFAFDAAYWVGDTEFQFVLLPFFEKNRTFFYGRDFALAAPGSAQAQQFAILGNAHPSTQDKIQDSFWGTEIPSESLAGASAAFRLSSSLLGWDVALSAYYGWDRTPDIEIDSELQELLASSQNLAVDPSLALLDPAIRSQLLTVQQKGAVGEELLKVSYRRMMRFALEAEGIVGPFIFRMDLGFSPEQLYYTETLESVSLPTALAVAGVEYTYGETWYVSVTGFGTGLLNPPSKTTLFGVEASLPAGAVPGDRDYVLNYGALSVIRYNWVDQNLELSASALYNIEPDSYLGSFQLKYTDWEPHDFRVGIMLLGGSKGTLFGNFEGNDFAYIQYGASW